MVGRLIVGHPGGPGALPSDYFKAEGKAWMTVPPAAQKAFPAIDEIMRKKVSARRLTTRNERPSRIFAVENLMEHKVPSENVKLKRAYEPPDRTDGTRVLIDRLWPRGVKKTDAKIDEWMKDIAPSTRLRKWFGHDPARWAEFQDRYEAEVHQHSEQLDRLRTLARDGPLTLIFSAHDEAHNDAVVLRGMILGHRSHKHA